VLSLHLRILLPCAVPDFGAFLDVALEPLLARQRGCCAQLEAAMHSWHRAREDAREGPDSRNTSRIQLSR